MSSSLRRLGQVSILLIAAIAALVYFRAKQHIPAKPTIEQRAGVPSSQVQESQAPPQSGPQLQVLSSYPDDATAFAALAEFEVSELRNGLTLAQWLNISGHQAGWVETPKKELQPTDWPRKECTSYVKEDTLPSRAQVVSAVYFYPPSAPSPAIFPTLRGRELIATCVLAVIRVEASSPVSDFESTMVRDAEGSKFSRLVNPVVQQRFSQEYGESISTKNVPFWGSTRAEEGARWIANAEIVAGYDSKGLFMPDQEALVSAPFVFVRARLPLVRELELSGGKSHYDPAKESVQFHRAIALAQADSGISQRMEKLYDLDTSTAIEVQKRIEEACKIHCPDTRQQLPQPTGDDWRKPLVPVLRDWFQALKSSEPARRAAGLVAADGLLKAFDSVGPWGHLGGIEQSKPEDESLRQELQGLGARFDRAFADGSYYYNGNWVNEARQLAPDSEGSTLALLIWMSRGDGCLAGGTEFFRNVISEGNALLQRNIDVTTAAQAHFMVGDAYTDMVALSEGPDPNGDYASVKLDNPAESRAKALEHYHAGLSIDNTSEEAKAAWRQAWKLSAGLLADERYVCFGD